MTISDTKPEAIAVAQGRPLYVLFWPHLYSRNFEDYQQRITEALLNAENWGAILALECAATLLQAPAETDFKREAYSSALWHRLELHRGIIIIMTDQDGSHISESIRSRISLAIRLPTLNIETRANIWLNLITAVSNVDDRNALQRLTPTIAPYNLNGHQLRNCLATALVLADRGDRPIQKRHIELALAHDAEFTASGSTVPQRETHKHTTRPFFKRIDEGDTGMVELPTLRPVFPWRTDSGKSVRFDDSAYPFPTITSPSRPTPQVTVSASVMGAPETPTAARSPPATPMIASTPLKSPIKSPRSPRPVRPPRPSRPSMLRRHTTQGSLDPPVSTETPGGGWTWKMLPAHVRRPQLQFEKGLPESDDEGIAARRKKAAEREGSKMAEQ